MRRSCWGRRSGCRPWPRVQRRCGGPPRPQESLERHRRRLRRPAGRHAVRGSPRGQRYVGRCPRRRERARSDRVANRRQLPVGGGRRRVCAGRVERRHRAACPGRIHRAPRRHALRARGRGGRLDVRHGGDERAGPRRPAGFRDRRSSCPAARPCRRAPTKPAPAPVVPQADPAPTATRLGAADVQAVAAQYGVSPSLAAAIAWQESGFNNAMVSSANARGVMQVMPGTWDYVQQNPLPWPLDPSSATDNVHAGVMYLRRLLDETGGDENAAIAGYYQGLRSVQERGLYDDTEPVRRERAGAAREVRRPELADTRSRGSSTRAHEIPARRRIGPYLRAMTRAAPADRRLRRRRLLPGGGQPAARRLRARPGERPPVAPARVLPADRERRRRPLHRALLPDVQRRPLRGVARVAVPPRPGAPDPADHLVDQDLIYVGGGSVISMLGAARARTATRRCAPPGRRASCSAA